MTTVATERFLSRNGLNELIAKRLAQVSPDQPEAFERHSGDIRAAIINAAVPPDIAGEIVQAYRDLEKKTRPGVRVAVRSSAVGEDTEATFAGQYETVLNVVESGILEAYKQVLASKYSPRVRGLSPALRTVRPGDSHGCCRGCHDRSQIERRHVHQRAFRR